MIINENGIYREMTADEILQCIEEIDIATVQAVVEEDN